jgi:hypothetical protein
MSLVSSTSLLSLWLVLLVGADELAVLDPQSAVC